MSQNMMNTWLIGLLLTAAANVCVAEEKQMLKAVVSWNGHGQVFESAAGQQEFLGTLDGVMYIETAEGALNEAFVECTASHVFNQGESLTRLDGKCKIIQSMEDSVLARYDCEGEPGACKGTFTLTGGTGAFRGISGSSPLIMRSPLRHLAHSLTGVEEFVVRHGVMVLPELSYSIEGGRK